MIDHLIIGVNDLPASRAFYERALAPLGMAVLMDFPGLLGFGADGKPSFWIGEREPSGPLYGAFVLDPDGNNVEAVTHRPE